MELEILQKKLELKYYLSILSNINESDGNYEWLKSHCDQLTGKLNADKEKMSESQTEKKTDTVSPIETKIINKFFQMKSFIKSRGPSLMRFIKSLK